MKTRDLFASLLICIVAVGVVSYFAHRENTVHAQQVTFSTQFSGPATGTTGAISGVLLAGGSTQGTAVLTGPVPSRGTGTPCMASPNNGTTSNNIGIGVSITACVTSMSPPTATVTVTGALAVTLVSKQYNVTCA